MTKSTFLLAALLCSSASVSYAQTAPSVVWQQCFGGSKDDWAFSIISTSDSGFAIADKASSNNGNVTGVHDTTYGDGWMLKLSAAGDIQWAKCLGGTNDDVVSSIIQTKDGGFAVAGYTASRDGDVSGSHDTGSGYWGDYWVVKLSAAGAIQWQKCLGGTFQDLGSSIIQTADQGFAIAGSTTSSDGDVTGYHNSGDFWIVKLNASGDLAWEKALGGDNQDGASSIIQTSDSGLVVAGLTGSTDGDVTGNNGGWDGWILKLNASGDLQWQKCVGGSSYDYAESILSTSDGGFIAACYTHSNDSDVSGNHGGLGDAWIVKLSSTAQIQWQKCIGGSGTDFPLSIIHTTDGGFAVAGYTTSNDCDVSGNHGGSDGWVIKLTAEGGIQWQKCIGGSGDDVAESISQTANGDLVVAGYTKSNNGDVSGNHGSNDVWVVKLSAASGVTVEDHRFESSLSLSNSPNPFRSSTIIEYALAAQLPVKLEIFDALGETVRSPESSIQAPGKHAITVDLADARNGVYYCRLQAGDHVETRPLVMQR